MKIRIHELKADGTVYVATIRDECRCSLGEEVWDKLMRQPGTSMIALAQKKVGWVSGVRLPDDYEQAPQVVFTGTIRTFQRPLDAHNPGSVMVDITELIPGGFAAASPDILAFMLTDRRVKITIEEAAESGVFLREAPDILAKAIAKAAAHFTGYLGELDLAYRTRPPKCSHTGKCPPPRVCTCPACMLPPPKSGGLDDTTIRLIEDEDYRDSVRLDCPQLPTDLAQEAGRAAGARIEDAVLGDVWEVGVADSSLPSEEATADIRNISGCPTCGGVVHFRHGITSGGWVFLGTDNTCENGHKWFVPTTIKKEAGQ